MRPARWKRPPAASLYCSGTTAALLLAALSIAGCNGDGAPPTVDAGPDLRGKVGRTIVLAGTPSTGSSRRWDFERRPLRSRAQINDASAATATVVPDVPGRYVVRFDVDGAVDRVTLDVSPANLLTPVDVNVVSGDGSSAPDYAMVIGGQSYAAPPLADGSANGFHVLLIDRASQEVMDNLSFLVSTDVSQSEATAQIMQMANSLSTLATAGGDLMLISSMAEMAPLTLDLTSLIDDIILPFGGTNDIADTTSRYSLAGIRGIGAGQAYQAFTSGASLQGYLTPDSSGNYTFVNGSYVAFHTRLRGESGASTNTILIRTTEYQATLPAGATGGFQLLVAERDLTSQMLAAPACASPPSPPCAVNQVFGTNGSAAEEELQALAAAISQYASQEFLLFVVSIGDPFATYATPTASLSALESAIASVGGNPFLIDTLAALPAGAPSTYTLVGSALPPAQVALPFGRASLLGLEASSAIANCDAQLATCAQLQTATVRGVLGRDRRNFFTPVDSTPEDSIDLDLYTIAYSAPRSWPVPAAGNAAQAAVFTYISRTLLETTASDADIRAQYSNGQFSSIYSCCLNASPTSDCCTVEAAQNGLPFPGTSFFQREYDVTVESSDWDAVVGQLRLEFGYVDLVQMRIGLITALLTQLQATVDDTIDTVFTLTIGNPTSTSDAQAQDWVNILSEIASVGWALAGLAEDMPEIGATLGSFSSVLALGATASNLADGSSVLQVELAATESDWKTQAANFFTQAQSGAQALGGLLFDDWGKLDAVGTRITDATMYPAWRWVDGPGGTADIAAQAFNVAMLREYYADSQRACSGLELDNSYGATYFGPTVPPGFRVVFSKLLCQAVQDPPSLTALQVLEPLGSCSSIPCPLGLARLQLLWTTFQNPVSDCPACGIFSDCTPCGEHSGCTATPAMAPPC